MNEWLTTELRRRIYPLEADKTLPNNAIDSAKLLWRRTSAIQTLNGHTRYTPMVHTEVQKYILRNLNAGNASPETIEYLYDSPFRAKKKKSYAYNQIYQNTNTAVYNYRNDNLINETIPKNNKDFRTGFNNLNRNTEPSEGDISS